MAEILTTDVAPAHALPQPAKQALFARVRYTREVTVVDDDPAAPRTEKLPGSARAEIDDAGAGTLVVVDYSSGTTVTVQLETAQGSVLFDTGDQTPNTGPAGSGASLSVSVPAAVFAALANRVSPSAVAVLDRVGRFVQLSDTTPDFSSFRLFVAPIRPIAHTGGGKKSQVAAVRKFLGLPTGGELTSFETALVQPGAHLPATVNTLGFQSALVRGDGTFEISIDIEGNEVAWLWWLLGPESVAGYQLDSVPTQPRRNLVVLLPDNATTRPAPGTGGGAVAGAPAGAPSLDVDETTLLGDPDRFSDDPGTACSPFSNPQRVLGERRFVTVLRIDQPEVSGRGSLKVSRPIALDLAPPVRLTAIVNRIAGAESGTPSALTDNTLIRLGFVARTQNAVDLRRQLGTSLLRPINRDWRDWMLSRTRGRVPVSEDDPVEWEGDPSIYQAATVAAGHLLEWRVQWRSNGYSLGDVSHTLTLAPRQTRRIAKVSWRRREEALRAERTEVRDALTQVTNRERDYSDAVSASLSEWARGGSSSRSTGVAGGVGFALGPVVIGGGAAHGSASSSSWQTGGRRVSANEQQNLRDAIRQFAESVRRLESTVVTEVSQEEEVEGISETLRNVNYCHALTVVYYEILRHLRVETGFAGVRECLFVPFSITPFDVDKALKWRDKLRHGMLDRGLRWALDRLDEVASGWAGSDIPPGRRSQHPVDHVTGSIYVQLSVERPRDQRDDEEFEQYLALWTPLAPLLGIPASRVVERLKELDREKDRFFQAEVAPAMAAKWADRLELELNGSALSGADFTLATQYRFGSTVRVDFTMPAPSGLTREGLQQIRVRTRQALPVGSVANLQHMTIHYYTDHFDRQTSSDRGARDLILPDTGQPDAGGADAVFVLTQWERENLRQVIEEAVGRLIVHLNSNLVYYHKVIWWLMDRDELYLLLDGFVAPYGRRFENGTWVDDTGRSLASVVERDPLAILGNTLVFRVAAGAFLGIDGHESPEAAHRYYYDSQVRSEPLRISLPTEGLYAQALMDPCVACEEHNGSTDWVLDQADPELEAIAGQLSSRRSAAEALTPTPLPDTIISLQNAPAAPEPSGFANLLTAVTRGDAFRDMAGLAGTQAAAQAALAEAAGLASGFGQKALDLQKAKLGTDDAKKKLDNIRKAEETGLIDNAEATRQASRVLEEQNTAAETIPLTKEEPVKRALDGAGASGTPIEVSRQNRDGLETVKVGTSVPDSGRPVRNFIIERDDLTAESRAFHPQAHDISGTTSFSVRIRETDDLPTDAFIRWSVPASSHGDLALSGGAAVQNGPRVDITGLRPGRTHVDVELRTPDGVVYESVKYTLCVPQFVTIDVDGATFTPFLTGIGLVAAEHELVLQEAKRACAMVLNTANVRTVWPMAPFNEALPTALAAGGPAAANVTAATLRGNPPVAARYGQTSANAGGIGPADFDELIDVFPGAFNNAVSGNANENVDELTNNVVVAIANSALTSSPEKALAMDVLGRLIGETLAHEIVHSLIGSTLTDGFHNARPGLERDVMNHGIDRSFTARTGFEIDQTKLATNDLTQVITHDRGVVFINIPTGTAQSQLDRHFPVRPAST